MQVLFWGCYDKGKPRTRILIAGLRSRGVDVDEICAPIWQNIEDKSQIRGLGAKMRLGLRWLGSYPRLLWRLARTHKPDVIVVGYPGLLDVLLAWPIARLRKIPLVWDVFISVYDTVVMDRKLFAINSIKARLLMHLERLGMHCADTLCMDTAAHARRLETLFGLAPSSCASVWVGVEREVFTRPAPAVDTTTSDGRITVLFYGQFIPLHGIETIVRAAGILRQEPFDWILIGKGQESDRVRHMLDNDPLEHVTWIDWVPYPELERWIAKADICLGIFGTSEKASCVIPNKVFQIVASGKPLITGDSPAIRELLSPAPPCTYLVPMGNTDALADALRKHQKQVADGHADTHQCHEQAILQFDESAIGAQFVRVLENTLVNHARQIGY
jgi:glycosyltransferase involved in cell wall biosynthesis